MRSNPLIKGRLFETIEGVDTELLRTSANVIQKFAPILDEECNLFKCQD
jgi:hypothetical protein